MKKKKTKVHDWTEPAHLGLNDWARLKRIKELYEQGEIKEAMNFASFDCDTIIREEIPPHIWVAMGGTLTPAGEEKLRLYLDSQKSNQSVARITFERFLAFNGSTAVILPQTIERFCTKSTQRTFKSEKELKEIVLGNSTFFFGENTVLVDMRKTSSATGKYYPNRVLFDFTDVAKPRFYMLHVVRVKQDFMPQYEKVLRFLSFRKNSLGIAILLDTLGDVIEKNQTLRNELESRFGNPTVMESLEESLTENPECLLVTNDGNEDFFDMLSMHMEAYKEITEILIVGKFLVHGKLVYGIATELPKV